MLTFMTKLAADFSFGAISLAFGLKYRFNSQNLSGQLSDGGITVIRRKPLEYSTTLLLMFTFIFHEKKKKRHRFKFEDALLDVKLSLIHI